MLTSHARSIGIATFSVAKHRSGANNRPAAMAGVSSSVSGSNANNAAELVTTGRAAPRRLCSCCPVAHYDHIARAESSATAYKRNRGDEVARASVPVYLSLYHTRQRKPKRSACELRRPGVRALRATDGRL